MAILELEKDIPVTMLIDDAEKASKGGWILPDPTSMKGKFNNNIAEELVSGDLAGVYNYCYRDILEEGERYKGRCTAPLLVDVESGMIVTNESNEIMILLNDYARRLRKDTIDLRPIGSEGEMDKATKHWFDLCWNSW